MVTEDNGSLTGDVALWRDDGAEAASSCGCGLLVDGGGGGLLLLKALKDWE